MKTKTKIIISVLVLFAVIVASAITIVAVYASSKQTLSSDISISYETENNIFASLLGGVYSNNNKLQDINVDIAGETTTGKFTLNNITIDKNDADGSAYLELKITSNQPDSENANIYINPTINNSSSSNITTTKLFSFEDEYNYQTLNTSYVRVSQGQGVYLRFVFTATDVYKSATLTGTINIKLIHKDNIKKLPTAVYTSTVATVGAYYPQSYVGNALNDELKFASSTDLVATDKKYSTYILENLVELQEYTYNGKKVAKLESSYVFNNSDTSIYFSTEDVAISSQTYFFYVQPVAFNIVGLNDDKFKYISYNLLGSCYYDKGGNSTSWADSDLRAFLKDNVLPELDIEVQEMTIHTGVTDSIWAPLQSEINQLPSDARVKTNTDLALATGSNSDNFKNHYWTSSTTTSAVWTFRTYGEFIDYSYLNNSLIGFCFAFVM